jgi:hypothetical protein
MEIFVIINNFSRVFLDVFPHVKVIDLDRQTNFDPVGLGETDNHFLMALFNAKDHCLKKAEGSVHNNLSYCTKNHSVYDHSAII